jgi:ATP-binding cassette subfamily B protein
MDHGRIVERGTHAGLLMANGLYAQMWLRQQAGAEEGRIGAAAAGGVVPAAEPGAEPTVLMPAERR